MARRVTEKPGRSVRPDDVGQWCLARIEAFPARANERVYRCSGRRRWEGTQLLGLAAIVLLATGSKSAMLDATGGENGDADADAGADADAELEPQPAAPLPSPSRRRRRYGLKIALKSN